MSIEANKQFHAMAIKAADTLSDGQLALINMYTLSDLDAEGVYVRTAYLAHNAIDRDNDVFDDALLQRFADTLPGKGLFVKHPRGYDGDSGPGAGRWFDAHVVEMSHDEARAALKQPNLQWPAGSERAKLLETSFYIPRTESKQTLIEDIDAGVAGDVSIGFIAAERSPILDGSDNVVAHRLHAPGEALEGSLVWLGAQPGARIHKQAKSQQHEDDDMKLSDEEIKSLQDKAATADSLVTANKELTDTVTAIKEAVGDDLFADTKALAQVVAESKQHKDDLLEQIVAAERQAGLVGDADADKDAALAMFKDWDVSRLQNYMKRYDSAPASGMSGGQPAARGDGDADQGEKDAFNPMQNAAVTGKAA